MRRRAEALMPESDEAVITELEAARAELREDEGVMKALRRQRDKAMDECVVIGEELDAARARVGGVRELHLNWNGVCRTCVEPSEGLHPAWPCATIRALDTPTHRRIGKDEITSILAYVPTHYAFGSPTRKLADEVHRLSARVAALEAVAAAVRDYLDEFDTGERDAGFVARQAQRIEAMRAARMILTGKEEG